jgi:3-oxoacyl-[acyl-carrier protein] reductase
MSQRSLEGKVALITGGGRGIGKETALLFAREGAAVAISATTETQIEEVAEEVRALGVPGLAIRADVGYGDQVQRMVERTVKELGPIDILINNAGSFTVGEVKDFDEELWDSSMRVNLKSFFLCCRAALNAGGMLERETGHIINVASIMMRREAPNLAIHASFKHGVLGFSESLRREVSRQRIKVTVVAPSVVDTAMVQDPAVAHVLHRRERWVTAQDCAELILFVANRPPHVDIGDVSILGL